MTTLHLQELEQFPIDNIINLNSIDNINKIVDSYIKTDQIDKLSQLAISIRINHEITSVPKLIIIALAERLRYYNMVYKDLRVCVLDVILSVSDLTSMYSHALLIFGDKKKVPLAIKKGVADGFNKFSEEDYINWVFDPEQIHLRDVLCIVHPKGKDKEHSILFNKIKSGTLLK
jgi:hypothetical protein